MKAKKMVVVWGLAVAFSTVASATLIVDFTASANVNSRSVDVDTTTGDTWNFSDSTVLIGSGGGSNDKVYGGMTTTWSDSATYAPPLRWLNGAFQVQVLSGTSDTSAEGIILWDQADFLNGADSQTVGFSASDSLSVNLSVIGANSREFRFVVNQGGAYYVSNVSKTDGVAGLFSIDPASVSWRTISTDGSYTIGETASMIALDNIQSVGLYLNAARGANQTNIQFNDFQANATVVPEPAVVGLMGLGAFSAICLRRIRL